MKMNQGKINQTESTTMDRMRRIIMQAGTERAPDFYGIGAEKCGTTWLWNMFRDHPDIGVPLPKELRYFAHLYMNTGLSNFNALNRLLSGPSDRHLKPRMTESLATELRMSVGSDPAYKRIFGAIEGAVVGDISPQYCMLPEEGIAHMKHVAPDAKIIMMLRDPVSRAISAGKMKAGEEHEELTDELVREKALQPFQLEMSRYCDILDKFEAAFDGRVFVGFMDDVRDRPLNLLSELCDFLGVAYSPKYFPKVTDKSNEGRSYSVGPKLTAEIWGRLKDEYPKLEKRFPERVAKWREQYANL